MQATSSGEMHDYESHVGRQDVRARVVTPPYKTSAAIIV